MKQKKSLLTVAIMLFAAFGAFAQDPIEKGAWLFSGGSNLGYNSSSATGGGTSSNFNIALQGGYFFIDNLAGGVLFEMNSPSGGTTSTGIGLFGRYYFNGQIFVGAGFLSRSGGGASQTLIPLQAGYAFFLTKNVAVEPSLNFTTYDGGSDFGVRMAFAVYLGRE